MNLLEHPYPMCQILQCFAPAIYMQLYYDALQQFIELTPDQLIASKWNLYSFLINAQMTDKWLAKCQSSSFNSILQRIDTDDFPELPLVLLSSKSMPLLRAYKTYINHRHDTEPYTKRSAFFIATNRNAHFFERNLQDCPNIVEPEFLSDVLRLVKLAILISNKPIKSTNDFKFYDEVWKQFKQINAINLSDNQKILYNEFARMLSLHDFVRTNRRYENLSDSLALKVFASKYNILDFFYRFNEGSIITHTSEYQLLRNQLLANQTSNQLINANLEKDAKISEIHMYDLFYTISLVMELLLLKPVTRNYEDIVQTKTGEVKQIIDNIDDPIAYIESVEYLFTLLFLRWEHVNAQAYSSGKLTRSTSATTTMHESDTSYIENTENGSGRKLPAQVHNKTGFTCSYKLFQNMLRVLSSSIINRKDDQQNETLKQRYTCMTATIDDAKWRLQLLDLYYSSTNCIHAPTKLKTTLTSRYKQFIQPIYTNVFNSSDEEIGSMYLTVPKNPIRRKPRRRISSKRSSCTGRSDTFINSTELEGRTGEVDLNASNASMSQYGNQYDRRRFMSKMLGQLTDMVAITVIRGDLNTAKSIIEVSEIEYEN